MRHLVMHSAHGLQKKMENTPLLKVVSLLKVIPKERLMVAFNQEDLAVKAARLPDGIA